MLVNSFNKFLIRLIFASYFFLVVTSINRIPDPSVFGSSTNVNMSISYSLNLTFNREGSPILVINLNIIIFSILCCVNNLLILLISLTDI